jgi:hypothetical protein
MRNYRRRRSLVNGIDGSQRKLRFQDSAKEVSFFQIFSTWRPARVHYKIRYLLFDHERRIANGRADY